MASASKNGRTVFVCRGTGCISSGANDVYDAFKKEIKKAGLKKTGPGGARMKSTGCPGLCEEGPVVVIEPEGIFYGKVKTRDVPKIVESHLKNGEPVERLFYRDPATGNAIKYVKDIPFYANQTPVILKNCGHIDPEVIQESIDAGIYQAAEKALTGKTPAEIIETIKASGLRGRGGGGFPAAIKWQICSDQKADQKYLICNADEGDPGAFMDRAILEASPHQVIEGMTIAGYAIGATKGFVYVRAEYPLAFQRLQVAVDQAREKGYLGKNLYGSGFDFDLKLFLGAGAFVCGEETALITSIEGFRGMPHPRPPYPAVKGLWGKPTIINNVKTFSNVPLIINEGADWYSGLGTEKSPGTAVFALSGKIANSGLVEVPMGTTIREIIFDVGGGIKDGKKFKAVQTGGPSGGCIPAELIDMNVDFDELTKAGSMMGSGGMIVMDEESCMVDIARYFLSFTQHESCGKCTPCRMGTRQLLNILERITRGEGKPEDIDTLEKLGSAIKATSLCGLGTTAPNPVLSTLRYFRNEYEAHINEGRCPALVCKALLTYTVVEETCTRCGFCQTNCPTDCIAGRKKSRKDKDPGEPFIIDQDKCIQCGMCFIDCPVNSIIKTTGNKAGNKDDYAGSVKEQK